MKEKEGWDLERFEKERTIGKEEKERKQRREVNGSRGAADQQTVISYRLHPTEARSQGDTLSLSGDTEAKLLV